ncbi:MAG: PilZ domain-containing protein [Nitrospinae bacterium]|nr:PilZ domain-containing protein [Nitrospinota bacterium]
MRDDGRLPEAPSTRPTGLKDARDDYRVRLPLPVKYRVGVRQQDGKYVLSPEFRGVGVDFSGGGAAFKIGKEIPAGFFVHAEIPFPFQQEPIMVVGEVLRTKPDLLRNQKVFLCVVRYLLINPDARDKMVGHIIGEVSRRGRN